VVAPAVEHCAGALAEGSLHVAVVGRELSGGECSYWACIPSKTRSGEAVHGAREAAASAGVDIEAALAWRDFAVPDLLGDLRRSAEGASGEIVAASMAVGAARLMAR
jgi:pyruvate/2-oxoglutarate dehydrogenase complex dihydrolipoamide dehydrogenase (E3) component